MTPFTSILAATDFSIGGNNAARRAALLAHEHGAPLKLVHVLDPAGCRPLWGWSPGSIDFGLQAAQARESLRRLALEIAGRHGLSPSVEVRVGEPLETLLRASQRAELLVLGRRGHGRFRALRAGRTVDRLFRTCRRPVLVVKMPAERAYRRVLVPVDFSVASDAAVQAAARLAHDGGLHVFHAINSHRDGVLRDTGVPDHLIRESGLRQQAGILARLRRQAARLGLDSTRMGFAVDRGHPVWSTLRHAHRLQADLIVAGRQGRSTLGEWLLGSVSGRLLAGSACDMLMVPQPRAEALGHAAPPPLRLAAVAARADRAARSLPRRVA